jgi:hypothetical protein
MTKLVPSQDLFIFLMEEAMDNCKYVTKKPIYQGLASLVDNNIIARGPADSLYYINPLVAFNGNRVTYARTYVKKLKKIEVPDNQMSLFDFQQSEPQIASNSIPERTSSAEVQL